MMIGVAFWVFLIAASAFMLTFGRLAERFFIATVIAATVSTLLLNGMLGPTKANVFVISIDVALWVVALLYAAHSDRYWPIWFAAFHSITIATELGSVMFPGSFPKLYINLAGAWALPALGAAAFGVRRDRKLV